MSDSGFTNIPPRSAHTPQTQRNVTAERPNARIIGVPDELRDVRQITRIRGEVIRQKTNRATKETTVNIRTSRGEIEVRLPPDQPPPKEGQKVDVEIQPGRPPQAARIKIVRTETATVDQHHAAKPEAQTTQSRPTDTPVNIEVGTTRKSTPRIERPTLDKAPPLPQTLPEPGTTVRLHPIPAREVAEILTQNLPDIITISTAQIPPAITTEAQIIAEQTPLETITNTINTPVPSFEKVEQSTTPEAIIHVFNAPTLLPLQPDTQPQPLSSLPQNIALAAAPQPTASAQLSELTPAITIPGTAVQTPTLQTPPLKQPIDVKIDSIQPPRVELIIPGTQNITPHHQRHPPAQPHQILTTPAPGILTGTVIGTTADNLPVLNIFLPQLSSTQNFALQVPSENITIGTQIEVTPQTSLSTPAQSAPPLTAIPLSTLLTPDTWPLMEELYQTLARVAPLTAQAFSNVTPNASAPAQITPAALFFISAIRGGDLTQWLGDKASDLLRSAGRGNLLSRLSQEGSLLNRLSGEPVSQDWRAISLPMFYEGEIQKIALHYKHEEQNSSDEQKKSKNTRFIFDLNLDQMGAVQVDGLFQPGRLDLVVRTGTPLSQAMQMDMRQTYSKALRQTEVTGELTFQNQPDQWVTIKANNTQSLGMDA